MDSLKDGAEEFTVPAAFARTQFLPDRFALYKASSARRINSSEGMQPSSAAIPTLHVTCNDPAVVKIGCSPIARRISSPRLQAFSMEHPGRTIRNSSPPYRPAKSYDR